MPILALGQLCQMRHLWSMADIQLISALQIEIVCQMEYVVHVYLQVETIFEKYFEKVEKYVFK